jgi:hypothetical protein
MPRCYFHLQNGVTTLDCDGVDLPDMAAVQTEAAETVASALREDAMDMLWNGEPLRLWVTDEPRGAGKTLVALRVVRE